MNVFSDMEIFSGTKWAHLSPSDRKRAASRGKCPRNNLKPGMEFEKSSFLNKVSFKLEVIPLAFSGSFAPTNVAERVGG
jgi:hypothetical protein